MKIFTILFILLFATIEISDARMRSGRSFGRRGSRSLFGAKKRTTNTYNRKSSRTNNQTRSSLNNRSSRSGGFMKSMMGAVAGTMIGGMIFRAFGMGGAGAMGGGSGGMGILLPILLLVGAYFLFFRRRKSQEYATQGSSYNETDYQPAMDNHEVIESESHTEEENQLDIATNDRFLKDRSKEFFSIQHAWSKKNLSPIKSLLSDEVFNEFQTEIDEMKSKNQTSTLENLMINDVQSVASWNEEATKFVTLKFEVSLIEYVTDENQNIISGQKDSYTDISEFWTFSQDGFGSNWRVTAVENQA